MQFKELCIGLELSGKNRRRRATFASRRLKESLRKHFRQEVSIDNSVNNFIWARGKAEAPRKLSLVVSINDKEARAYLKGSKALEILKKKIKEEKEKKEKSPAKKKEEKEKKDSSQNKKAKTDKAKKSEKKTEKSKKVVKKSENTGLSEKVETKK